VLLIQTDTMNKRIYLIILLFTCRICSAQTPSWIWARSAGGVSNDYNNAVCSDANGNVYVTGTFQGSSITFGSYTLNNTGTGALNIFVVKYDASGNVLWAQGAGGTDNDWAYGICVDASGNVYVTGYFRSPSITFGTITLNNTVIAGGSRDIFITKFNSVGSVLWAQSAGGSGDDMSNSICLDANNNVYITGTFGWDSNIAFGNDSLISKGAYDIFIAKYDSSGNFIWARNDGGTQEDGGLGICIDASNNIYITGYFQTLATFDIDTIHGIGNVSICIAKFDTSGNNIWAKSAVGTLYDWNYGTSIAASGNSVYITGYFMYSVIFGSDTLGNSGNWSIFTAKYDTSGNALWGRCPGGTDYDYGNSISADSNGHVFVTGYFASSFLNFGGIPALNTNVGYDDIFVVEYDASGSALWATSVGGTDNDYGMGICTSGGNNVYITGYYGSYNINFGSTTLNNNGSYDVFLAKLGFPTGIEENNLSFGKIFPNPFLDRLNITVNSYTLSEIILYDIASRKLLQQKFTSYVSLNTEQLAKGIYIYEVRNKNGLCKKGKVVKD
jgi:hypothetical protein